MSVESEIDLMFQIDGYLSRLGTVGNTQVSGFRGKKVMERTWGKCDGEDTKSD